MYTKILEAASALLLFGHVDHPVYPDVLYALDSPARPADFDPRHAGSSAQAKAYNRLARRCVAHARGGVVVDRTSAGQVHPNPRAESLPVAGRALQPDPDPVRVAALDISKHGDRSIQCRNDGVDPAVEIEVGERGASVEGSARWSWSGLETALSHATVD